MTTVATVERPTRVAYAAALIGLIVVLDTTIMVIAAARLADEFGVGLKLRGTPRFQALCTFDDG